MGLNEEGWNAIFNSLPIVQTIDSVGFFDITAEQIKQISSREARNMAKIDFRENVPTVMAKDGISILAVLNGTYRIGRFDPFINLNPVSLVKPKSVPFPSNILTLSPQRMAHESAVLDIAAISGMLNQVFGEKTDLTIRGRTRSPNFNFKLNNVNFNIAGVQIEVDGGYEGQTSVNLVEAKIGPRNNISIRQLLYPQLSWEKTLGNTTKRIRTYICFYQEPIIRFIPIKYNGTLCEADHANEIAFIIEPEAKLDLATISLNRFGSLPDKSAPFPQADSMDTVLAMLTIVAAENSVSKEQLQMEFGLTDRQIDYYTNVLWWLGFAKSSGGNVQINEFGKTVASLSHAQKVKKIAEITFSDPIFHFALRNKGVTVPPALFARWRVLSESTQLRRTQTVNAWIKYFEALT